MKKKEKKVSEKQETEKVKNEKTKKNKTANIPSTVAESIPYLNVYDNGIIEVKECTFSKTYRIPDVNFVTTSSKAQEDLATQYSEFLCSLGSDVDIQITLYNKTIDKDKFRESILLPLKNDDLDKYRLEYNDVVTEKMNSSKNNLVTDKFITITLKSHDVFEASKKFVEIDKNINNSMLEMTKMESKPLSIVERLDILNNIYNQDKALSLTEKIVKDDKEIHSFSLENCARQGITTKDVIAPSSFTFKNNIAMVGDLYVKTYSVSAYPTWIKGTLLTSFSEISTNVLVNAYFRAIEQQEAIKLVKRQRVNISSKIVETQKKSVRSGIDSTLISPTDQDAKDEATELIDRMTKDNVKLFVVNFIVTLFADSEEKMSMYEDQLKTIADRNLLTMRPMDMEQENALNSALPIGNKQLYYDRLMTSLSIASIIPFDTKEINQKNGIYYGTNVSSKNLIIYNRKSDVNPNSCVLGMPGAGKSFFVKQEMTDILLNTDDEVYVIDPEREYKPLADAYNGVSIKISPTEDNFINPFDLNLDNVEDEGDDPVKNKCGFIQAICEIMVNNRMGLTSAERSIIDRVTMMVYDDYLEYLQKTGKKYDYSYSPTLLDFYNRLLDQPQPEAVQLALSLERFVKGSVDIFSKRTNVDITNRFTVFDIKDSKELKEVALQVCFDHIWNKMIENFEKGKSTWIYIDEFYLMMKKTASAEYISQIWKRARKWNGLPCAITQNVEDMLNSPEARTVINNCSFITMLRQSDINRSQLSVMLGISQEEQKYISSPKAGVGLLQIGGDFIPIDSYFPTDTQLYKIMTTKADERIYS